jgi:hypothetical protein
MMFVLSVDEGGIELVAVGAVFVFVAVKAIEVEMEVLIAL